MGETRTAFIIGAVLIAGGSAFGLFKLVRLYLSVRGAYIPAKFYYRRAILYIGSLTCSIVVITILS